MGNAISNFWSTAIGGWVLGILGIALAAGAAASIKSQVDIAVMQTNFDNQVIANTKVDSLFNADLTEIKSDVKELKAAFDKSSNNSITFVDDIDDIEKDVDKIELDLKDHERDRSVHK